MFTKLCFTYLCITFTWTLTSELAEHRNSSTSKTLENFITTKETLEEMKSKTKVHEIVISKNPIDFTYRSFQNGQVLIFYGNIINSKSQKELIIHFSTDHGKTFKVLELKDSGQKYVANSLELKEGFYSFYSADAHKIFHTKDFNSEWTSITPPSSFKQFFINPKNQFEGIFIVENKNEFYLHITQDGGKSYSKNIKTFYLREFYHGWLPSKQDTFLSVQWYSDINFPVGKIVHIKNGKSHDLLKFCRYLKLVNGIYSSKCREHLNAEFVLYISLDGYYFQTCIMPKKIKIKSYSVPSMSGNMIFVTVITATHESVLLSALHTQENKLYFRRILSDVIVYYEYGPSIHFHSSMEGMILAFTNINSQLSTTDKLISFNYGNTWMNVDLLVIKYQHTEFKCLEFCRYNFDFTNSNRKSDSGNNPISASSIPWMLVTLGTFWTFQLNTIKALFISRNTGFSWKVDHTGDLQYAFLDNGSIFLISNTYGNEFKFSIDEGRTFVSVKISDSVTKIHKIIQLSGDQNMKALIFATDSNNLKAFHVDFSQTFTKNCVSEDYNYWNLKTRSGDCISGQIYRVQLRKANSLCQMDHEMISKNEKSKCICTIQDFTCAYGYVIEKGKCVRDHEHFDFTDLSLTEKGCSFGTLYNQNVDNSHLIKIGHCETEGMNEHPDSEKEICLRFNKENMIIVYYKDKIELINLDRFPDHAKTPKLLTRFPKNVQDAVLDLHHKTLYAVIKDEIYYYSYAYEESININWEKLDPNVKVKHIHFDFDGNNIYFQNMQDNIEVFSLKSRMRRLIYSTTKILNFKIFPHLGAMLIKTKNSALYLCRMDGTECVVVSANNVGEYSLDGIRNFVIYTNTFNNKLMIAIRKSFFNQNYDKLYQSEILMKMASQLVLVNSQIMIYFDNYLERHWIESNVVEKADIYLKDVIKFETYTKMSTTGRNCQNFGCNGICIDAYDKPVCWCMDGYKLEGTICIKDDPNVKTTCESNQKTCDNGQCVNSRFWCDGKVDCKDGSDERNCPIQECQYGQFTCSSRKCISNNQICDGLNDCGDNSDETCEKDVEIASCESDQFQCQNGRCISKSGVCNGIHNCPDGSDEVKCEKLDCNISEFKCLDESCVDNTKLCDGISDCSFSEDENATLCECRYFCNNGTCLYDSQICNGINDCLDEEDESNCVSVVQSKIVQNSAISSSFLLLFIFSVILIKYYPRLRRVYDERTSANWRKTVAVHNQPDDEAKLLNFDSNSHNLLP